MSKNHKHYGIKVRVEPGAYLKCKTRAPSSRKAYANFISRVAKDAKIRFDEAKEVIRSDSRGYLLDNHPLPNQKNFKILGHVDFGEVVAESEAAIAANDEATVAVYYKCPDCGKILDENHECPDCAKMAVVADEYK